VKKMYSTLCTLLLSAVGLLSQPALAFDHDWGNHVYVMSNGSGPNSVVVLERTRGGQLEKRQEVSTGGLGTGAGTASVHDPLGSQGALLRSEDGHWLYASNAGSNQISVLRIREDGLLSLSQVIASGGTYPVSLAQRGELLYALNTGGSSAGVATFRIGPFGHLESLPGLTRSLNLTVPYDGAQPNEFFAPSQLGFSPDGHWLAISIKNRSGLGSIELFAVDELGRLAQHPVTTTSDNPLPFGFAFDRHGHMLVSEAHGGAVSSYAINSDGTMRTISASVANNQPGNCWVEITRNFAYTTNTDSNTLSAYVIGPDGSLKLLNGSDAVVTVPGDIPLDFKISSDGRFLYSNNPGSGSVTSFRIERDGSLTLLDRLTLFAPLSGQAGMAVD